MTNRTSKEIQSLDLDNWKRGMISYFSKSRLQNDALKTAYNVIYDYDAVVRTRGSFLESSIPDLPEGLEPLGCDFAFKRENGTVGLLNLFTDGTDAHLYVLNEQQDTWNKLTAFTFNKDKIVSFDQIAGVVVIGNGVDKFTYYDIESNQLKRLVKVADPTDTPTLTKTGMSGTAVYDYYYRVAFNGVGGCTKMSPHVKTDSPTLRETWAGTSAISINISNFTIDPNAKSWNVYVAMVATGTGAPGDEEYLLVGENIPPTQTQFTDSGEITILQSAPVENSTEGIIAKYFKNISNRLWAIGANNVVYWGGDQSRDGRPGNELYFGSANGSDRYAVGGEGANIEVPMAIALGRDNSGTTCINLFTRTQAGLGAIWDIYATTSTIQASGQTFSTGTYQFKKREGNDGTDAPFSILHENNNFYYLSMDGFKSTGVKPNITGIQSTDIISSAIRDRVINLAHSNLSRVYAAHFDESIYWTVAYGSDRNNEIWVYDILHGGVWSIWRIPADCIFRWTSKDTEAPSLYIRQGNKLLRYFKNSRTHADATGTFEAYIESGLVPFKNNKLEWVHLLKAIWQFDAGVGEIDLTINIHDKNGKIVKSSAVAFSTIKTDSDMSGWDASIEGSGMWDVRGWDKSTALLDIAGDATLKKLDQKVRKNAAYVSFVIKSNTPNTYWELSRLSLLFTYIGLGVEFLSQRGVMKI